MSDVPESHPRYQSLRLRDQIVEGVEIGITSNHGLIAHGRGEAFDYLFGERTHGFAVDAVRAAGALLLIADQPVISVNGNAAALAPSELATLSKLVDAPLEVNIFHKSSEREGRIAQHLATHGATHVLLPSSATPTVAGLDSNRRFVNAEGILQADTVFVPLEDGDRCEALIGMGKRVITVDLNPLSRTARAATITIIDNVVRALPYLIRAIPEMKRKTPHALREIVQGFDNDVCLSRARTRMRNEGSAAETSS